VDTFEEEEEVDIEANIKELAKVDAELAGLEVEMQKHLKALGIGE
jgi:type I restriction enzyme M protein